MSDIQVSIYEDNDRLRETLAQLIDVAEGVRLVAAYPHCRDVVRNTNLEPPDVIIMDIDMPGMTGIEGVKLVKEAHPEINILMLTVFDDADNLFNAICAGATGYLLKKTPAFKIIDSIKDVHAGGAPMNATIARKVLELFSNQNTRQDSSEKDQYKLTEREKEILSLLVSGNSYKQIAAEINLSIDTVRYHIKNIYNKLHVHSMSEAVAKAIREKII